MEKSLKIVIFLSIPVIVITAIITGIYAPSAYVQQCRQQVNRIVTDLYDSEGGKDEFTKDYDNQNLSVDSQKTLQKLSTVINQCPELQSLPTNNSDFGYNSQSYLPKQGYQV